MADTKWSVGDCWRCDAVDLPVMWLGPVHCPNEGDAPFHACEPCIRRLEDLVRAHYRRVDASA
ncbi:hypothetical protein ACGFW5_31585 [Streptomyces sp. NPDC048416]|uniref:hypothetical protein n=1 Tax=Streptomyces sp. NPDC048416 TaxID=3365546 RepID=UPI00371B7CBD